MGNAINPVTYQGMRVSGLWDINKDWNALLTQSYQNIDAEGVFYQMPNSSDGVPLPPQSVTLFNPSYNNDKFENTALTINGRVSDLKLVYAGAYLVRNISQVQDYTNYARGMYADYYQCHGAEPANRLAATCFSPSSSWNETERNTHQSHEFRVSTPDDWRMRGILGAYLGRIADRRPAQLAIQNPARLYPDGHDRMLDRYCDHTGQQRQQSRHAQ